MKTRTTKTTPPPEKTESPTAKAQHEIAVIEFMEELALVHKVLPSDPVFDAVYSERFPDQLDTKESIRWRYRVEAFPWPQKSFDEVLQGWDDRKKWLSRFVPANTPDADKQEDTAGPNTDLLLTEQAAKFTKYSTKTILNWYHSKDEHGNPMLPGARILAGKLYIPKGVLLHLVKPERTRKEPPKVRKKATSRKPVKK